MDRYEAIFFKKEQKFVKEVVGLVPHKAEQVVNVIVKHSSRVSSCETIFVWNNIACFPPTGQDSIKCALTEAYTVKDFADV